MRVTGIVCNAFFPTDGKMAGGICLAEEKARGGGAALFTGVPRFQDALNFILQLETSTLPPEVMTTIVFLPSAAICWMSCS